MIISGIWIFYKYAFQHLSKEMSKNIMHEISLVNAILIFIESTKACDDKLHELMTSYFTSDLLSLRIIK